MITTIKVNDAVKLDNSIILDVRSPKEYHEDHILGAINLPLLDDQERHEIGIIYKQKSREAAIERGMELLPSKIPSIMSSVKDHRDKNIIVYCARGGMRSQVIAGIIDSIGFKVYKIEGGYKHFRKYILDKLDKINVKSKVLVLYGLTCTGKTKLLQQFNNSLDLEGLAQHRSSLYGAVGLEPRSQKKFENLLLQRLDELQDAPYIIVEGESRRIGDIIIPEKFWKLMKKGTSVLVTRHISLRIKEMIDEYFTSDKNIEQIKQITPTLKRVISNKNKQLVLDAIDSKDFETVGKILLTKYYDPLYEHTLKQQEFMFEVCNDDITVGKVQLEKSASAQRWTCCSAPTHV